MVTVGVMMSLEDPQAEMKKDKETKQEADIVEKCAISVQDAGRDEGGGAGYNEPQKAKSEQNTDAGGKQYVGRNEWEGI